MNDEMVDANEIARIWNVTQKTVRRWANRDRIPYIRIGEGPGSMLKFDPIEVRRVLKKEAVK